MKVPGFRRALASTLLSPRFPIIFLFPSPVSIPVERSSFNQPPSSFPLPWPRRIFSLPISPPIFRPSPRSLTSHRSSLRALTLVNEHNSYERRCDFWTSNRGEKERKAVRAKTDDRKPSLNLDTYDFSSGQCASIARRSPLESKTVASSALESISRKWILFCESYWPRASLNCLRVDIVASSSQMGTILYYSVYEAVWKFWEYSRASRIVNNKKVWSESEIIELCSFDLNC